MADVFTALAVNCPPPAAPAANLGILTDPPTPTTYEDLSTGNGEQDLAVVRRNFRRGDSQGRSGGGLYGIISGFDVVALSGLQVAVTQGKVCFDGHVQLPIPDDATQQAWPLANNGYNWVYVANRTGQLGSVWSAAASPVPAMPAEFVFLKRVLMQSGSPTEFDNSGVFRLAPSVTVDGQGNVWVRRTADVGPPTDTPPSSMRFYTETLSGLYLWDGAAHRLISDNLLDTIASGAGSYVPQHAQRSFYRRHTVRGRSVIRGYVRVRA
jgi:hypothetical protein